MWVYHRSKLQIPDICHFFEYFLSVTKLFYGFARYTCNNRQDEWEKLGSPHFYAWAVVCLSNSLGTHAFHAGEVVCPSDCDSVRLVHASQRVAGGYAMHFAKRGLIMNFPQRHTFSFLAVFSLLCSLFAAIPKVQAAQQSQPEPNRQYTKAELQALSEKGDPYAQFLLAHYILKHNPTAEETQSAMKWLRASVAQNNPESQFYLGYLYEHGQFVPQNYQLAGENYAASAAQNYPLAENNLASLYQHGQGVKKNLGKAFELYLAAAQRGNAVAQINLSNMYYGGNGVAKDYAQTVYWLRKSAESGLPDAENNLAYFYFYGIAVQQDYTEAARLIQSAASKNLPGAETSLGYLYEQGKGVPLNYVEAYSWYSRGAAGGDKMAGEHCKQLAHLMTRKQMDEANALTTASATQLPAPTGAAIGSLSFSLLNH